MADDFTLEPPMPADPTDYRAEQRRREAERPSLLPPKRATSSQYRNQVPSDRAETDRRLAERRLRSMHDRHGSSPGNICANCIHFARRAGGRRAFPKCKLYGNSSSRATDWGFSWPACGLFERREAEEEHGDRHR